MEEFIENNIDLILKNLLTIRKCEKYLPSQFSVGDTLIRKLIDFCDINKLKVHHVYKDVREHCNKKYANASNDLLNTFNEISTDS